MTQPRELEVYLRTFEALRQMAAYGDQARPMIIAALEDFSTGTPNPAN